MQDKSGWVAPLPVPFARFLSPLATSLSHEDWVFDALTGHLALRLPQDHPDLPAEIALALLHRFPKGAAPDAGPILRFLQTLPECRTFWAFTKAQNHRPKHDLTSPRFLPDPALPALNLPAINTSGALADWLGISAEQLVRFADLRGLSARSTDRFGGHYLFHLIPKRNGSLRLIEEPKPFLKHLQRKLLQGLLAHIPPHDAAYGFRNGRNCLQAAARHAGEEMVVSFDLAHFFPSISFTRIYSLFRTLGYPAGVARDLSGLCTSILPNALHHHPDLAGHDLLTNRHLPQGAPTSPALANLAAYHLDCRLTGLAHRLDARYTRYADDLTFSGDKAIARALTRAVPAIVADAGFQLNPQKSRQAGAHQRQTVTGVVVNRTPNLPRAEFDRLKATLHHLSKPDDPRRNDKPFLAQLSGRIAWAEQINPARAAALRLRFDALFAGAQG